MDVPDIPSVNKKTDYQNLKGIIEKTRKTVQESHLVDSDTARIIDNPGGTRSIVVIGTEINQSGKEVLVINPTTAIYGSPYTTEVSEVVTWPDGTACTVDIADQDDSIAFCGYRVKSGYIYLRWISFASGSALPTPLSGDDITITAFL
jgi:hypothetical protein